MLIKYRDNAPKETLLSVLEFLCSWILYPVMKEPLTALMKGDITWVISEYLGSTFDKVKNIRLITTIFINLYFVVYKL